MQTEYRRNQKGDMLSKMLGQEKKNTKENIKPNKSWRDWKETSKEFYSTNWHQQWLQQYFIFSSNP